MKRYKITPADRYRIQRFYAQLAVMLRSQRINSRMTQAELGRLTGLGQQRISYLESPQARPQLSTLIKLSLAFGKRLSIFFSERY